MEELGDPRSTIDQEVAAYDAETDTYLADPTIRELISTYPHNQDIHHVLVKVITISTLYHARVLDIDLQPLAAHIKGIDALDARLKQGDPEVVDDIWHSQKTRRHYPSFATKFCSWHNQEGYAIYDGNAWKALAAYGAEGDPFTLPEKEFLKYAEYLAIVKRFQKCYGLENRSLKDIDKFLYRVGGRLIAAKKPLAGGPGHRGT